MAKGLFNKYIWLINIIYRTKQISFEEINERWLKSGLNNGDDLPLRTFHNYRKAIKEIFNIEIACKRKGNYTYYIKDFDNLDSDSTRCWMLGAFAINSMIADCEELNKRIIFEPIPKGKEYLTPVMEAIKYKQSIVFDFYNTETDLIEVISLDPYCLKVFWKRWFAIGRNHETNSIKYYPLDQFRKFAVEDNHFDYPTDFDPRSIFLDTLGECVDEREGTERIVIRMYRDTARYYNLYPLHHSQKLIETNDEFTTFQFHLHPTKEFFHLLKAYGENIEILEPAEVRQRMAGMLFAACERYK